MADLELPYALAELISDPDFLHLQRLEDQPNFFSAVGQTFRERWHSAFLGWLLDPAGSHGLESFPLLQFLVGLVGFERVLPPGTEQRTICEPKRLADLATSLDLDRSTVLPNERNPSEQGLGALGRIDVFVDVPPAEGDEEGEPSLRFYALIELKVQARAANEQERRYPDWIEKARAEGEAEGGEAEGVCVFLCPTEQLADSSEETIGDPRWYCADYQFLHDRVLVPCLAHRDLSPTMRPLVEHYVSNLRSALKGEKLAVTEEELELARRICRKHSKTFRMLAEVLKYDPEADEEVVADVEAVADSAEGPSGQKVIEVTLSDGTIVRGDTVRRFIRAALEHLDASGLIANVDMPFSTGGTRRWFLNAEAVHKSGRSFIHPGRFEPQTTGVQPFYFEVNTSRDGAAKSVKKLFRSAGLKVT